MSALMNTLRESLILERARALYRVTRTAPEDEAIEIFKLALRVERDEGIATGHKQAETYSDQLQTVLNLRSRKSEPPQLSSRKAQGKS